jgi:hypothetical protein
MSDRSILGFAALVASAGEDEIAKTGRALFDQLDGVMGVGMAYSSRSSIWERALPMRSTR